MRESPRTRRLRSDREAVERLAAESSILRVRPHGDPPERYEIELRGRSLARDEDGTLHERTEHRIEIVFHAGYPRVRPDILWRTPIFHPNVSAGGLVCLGGYGSHWTPSIHLDDLIEMLWDIARFASYDPHSPYRHEASRWVRTQDERELPLDDRPLRDRVRDERAATRAAPADDAIRFVEPEEEAGADAGDEPGEDEAGEGGSDDGIVFLD